jgi:site-specific DNA-methyltransferase (adenine-specific)
MHKITLLGQNKKNKVHCVNCVQGMKELFQNAVNIDLIVADPPYVISRESQFHTMKDRKKARTGTNFGDWDKDFSNKEWITVSYNVLKKGGSLVVFNDFKKISDIIELATSLGYLYKDTLVWEKSNPMPRNRDRRYVPSLEAMIWFVKPGAKWTFNRQKQTYQAPVFRYASESGGGFKRIHPTQKPVKLIEELIRIHSNEGETVLDPFMGSGTTGVSSVNTKREFIGFEIDEKYCNLANDRIVKRKDYLESTISLPL